MRARANVRSGPAGTGVFPVLRTLLRLLQAIAAVALFAVIAVVLAGVLPTYFGAESFTVYSGSMEPTIHVGSLAVVRPAKVSSLKPGDVITYRLPTQPDVVVTHRLIAVEQDESGRQRFRTKGDANNVEDLVLVDQSAVLGRVGYTVPYLGYLIEFSKNARGRTLFIVLPALLLALDFGRDRLKRRAIAAASGESAPTPADADRVSALLARGHQAVEAGHADLALKAADGVLAADPHNETAWLLKAQATPAVESQRVLLETALTLNPDSTRLAQALRTLESDVTLHGVSGRATRAASGTRGSSDAAG